MLRKASFILFLMSSHVAHAQYTVRYERVGGARNSTRDGEVYHISIKAGDRTVYSEETTLIPGCRDIPAVTHNRAGVIVVCGNSGGNHYTFRLIDVKTGALHEFDGGQVPPLFFSSDDRLNFKYTTERIIDGKLGYFPYSHNYDLKSRLLSLDYGGESNVVASSFYIEQYEILMSGGFRFNSTPASIVAALLYSGKPEYICKQVGLLGKSSYRITKADIAKLIPQLKSLGYERAGMAFCN